MTYNMKLRNQLLQFILMRESRRVKGKKKKSKITENIRFDLVGQMNGGMVLLKMKFGLMNGNIILESQENRFIFFVTNCDLT